MAASRSKFSSPCRSHPAVGCELDPLTQLAIAHGTDKYGEHFYTQHYHRHFAALRERDIVLLEAGIGGYDDPLAGGESLAMWRDYFPRGRIIGFDIVEKRIDLGPRVTVLHGSMADDGFVAGLGATHGPFDIIIDDGSHVSADTIRFFQAAFPLLADGGVFAIEDTQTSYWSAFGGSVSPTAPTSMNLVKQLLDEVDHAERRLVADAAPAHPFAASIRAVHRFHNLVLIEKGDNGEASNFAPDRGADSARRAALAEHLALLSSGGGSPGTAMRCARLMLAADDRDAALDCLSDALRRFPDVAQLRLMAARVAFDLGEVESAASHLRRLVASGSGRLDAHLMIAASPFLRRHFPALEAWTESCAAAADADIPLLVQAARVLEALRRRDRARHWLDHARTLLPGQPSHVAQDLAEAYRSIGETGPALAVHESTGVAPSLPGDAIRRATLLRAAGRNEEAEDMLAAALAIDWQQPRAHVERSRALAALGRDAEALEAAKAFLSTSEAARRRTTPR